MTQFIKRENYYVELFTRKYLDAIQEGDKSKEEYYKYQLRLEGVKI